MKTPREIAEQIVYRPDPNTSTAQLIEAAIVEAVKAEREACAKVAEGTRMTGPSFIGALHGAGWNDAIGHVVKRIRERGE